MLSLPLQVLADNIALLIDGEVETHGHYAAICKHQRVYFYVSAAGLSFNLMTDELLAGVLRGLESNLTKRGRKQVFYYTGSLCDRDRLVRLWAAYLDRLPRRLSTASPVIDLRTPTKHLRSIQNAT